MAAASVWGTNLRISIFGESHGPAVGVVIDGLPAGEAVDMDALRLQMSRRAPGRDKSSTPRKEADEPEFLSGLLGGRTTGAPLCIVIRNTNTRSGDYANVMQAPRPGHSDYAAYVKYRGCNDVRGGGHFSGRLTSCLCAAGAVCRQILERRGIRIGSHVASVGPARDLPLPSPDIPDELLRRLSETYFPTIGEGVEAQMRAVIEDARMARDSVGGVVEVAVTGLPAGLGGPLFGGVESNNDPFTVAESGEIRTVSNHAGGILGGITSGMPLVFRIAVKPTPSISQPQQSVDLAGRRVTELEVHGRHDPCIVPRAAPVAESAAAVAALELLLLNNALTMEGNEHDA